MYTVIRISDFGELIRKEYKTARGAIKGWLKESKKHPFEVAIDATSIDEVIKLRRIVKENKDWFLKCHEEEKNPYKAEFLLDHVNDPEKLDDYEFKMDIPCYPCVPFTVG